MSQHHSLKKDRPLPPPANCEIANCPRKPRYRVMRDDKYAAQWLCAAHLAEAIPESPLTAERVY